MTGIAVANVANPTSCTIYSRLICIVRVVTNALTYIVVLVGLEIFETVIKLL